MITDVLDIPSMLGSPMPHDTVYMEMLIDTLPPEAMNNLRKRNATLVTAKAALGEAKTYYRNQKIRLGWIQTGNLRHAIRKLKVDIKNGEQGRRRFIRTNATEVGA